MKDLFFRPDLEVSAGRAVLGIHVGAAAAAVLSVGLMTLPYLGPPADGAAAMVMIMAGYGLPIAFLGWLTGIVVIGGPAWVLLHEKGARGPAAAALTGAGAPMIAIGVFGIFAAPLLSLAVMAGAPGALAGWLVWRIAYRPAADGAAQRGESASIPRAKGGEPGALADGRGG